MRKSNTLEQVKNGLRLSLMVLIGLGALFLLFYGLTIACFRSHIDPGSSTQQVPRIIGWMILGGTGVGAFATAHKWAKALVGVFAIGALNGVFAITSGHLPNHAPIPRGDALLVTVVCVLMGLLLHPLGNRKLRVIDRSTLVGLVYVLVWVGMVESHRLKVLGLLLALIIAAGIWAFGYCTTAARRRHGEYRK